MLNKVKIHIVLETESENDKESTKLNANIPLPATGEEAMKRLLACKGKDPYRYNITFRYSTMAVQLNVFVWIYMII